MTSRARQLLIALAFCSLTGCRSRPPATEGPAAVSDRQQNEEGKMREWLGREDERMAETGHRGAACRSEQGPTTSADTGGPGAPP
jgi:hypothetical protein